ncbi:hypothetical protein AQPE_4299 [Aquipluma nitroreducens]|uniref:DUF2141 domain-containing protein n=1 Tax=Aquipluma nitroreducens TaxID=2010828 RepID=A0A5K7SEV6_9BACT|nr:DUF2141 domain-containing protein [Aquipluma nitroreducens]BBE20108.1 hypothetical protein AQPE_4299 [Aquipluma nitroreducens]
MNKIIIIIQSLLVIVLLSSFSIQKQEPCSLTIEVNELRNSKGTVLFTLYNREDAFPDEHYKKYFKKLTGKIVNGSSSVTFKNLPEGKYAVNILHDENNDGKIKKGIILPKEGIGFSNYESIGFSNRPSFAKASFSVQGDKKIKINIIYL